MFKRIPFEWVEPGVDPTEQHHPLPRTRGNLKDALPWIAGLILVAAIGYQKIVSPRLETGAAQKAAPTATATADHPALLSDVVHPTAMLTPTTTLTATATATPTPTVTLPPTPTPLPANILTFGAFENGVQTLCWCNLDTGEVGGDDLDKCRRYPPPSMCTP